MNKELLQERKKMIYDFICDELYVPMKAKEMAIVLNVPKSQRGELLEVLDALTADGKVEISGRGKYVKSEGKYLTGVFTAHPRGFGFVTVEGEEEDIFIPAAQTNGALHKDTVQITLSKNSSGKRKEGTVTKILSAGQSKICAGHFYSAGAVKGSGFRAQSCGGDHRLWKKRQKAGGKSR